jgi:Sulfotransferase family
MAEAPIFIIGNPRSGTTLLRLMLTCHPRIAVPPEAGFLIELEPRYRGFAGDAAGRDSFVERLLQSPKFEYWKLSEPVLRSTLAKAAPKTYAELVAGVYACWASVHQPGKPRWGDKNNFYLAHIDTIAALFPSAVFLHIVRDGRDVACSYRSLSNVRGGYAPSLPANVFDAAHEWNRNLGRIRAAFSRIGWKRVIELRYEDLTREPEAVLRMVCAFLGEEYAPAMLEYARENRERELEPRDFDAWKEKNRSGLDEAAIGRWKNDLTPAEAALVQLTGSKMLRQYGYAQGLGADTRTRAAYLKCIVRYRARHAVKWIRRLFTRAASSFS